MPQWPWPPDTLGHPDTAEGSRAGTGPSLGSGRGFPCVDGACGFGAVKWYFCDSVSWGRTVVPALRTTGSGYGASCRLPLGRGPQRAAPKRVLPPWSQRREGLLSAPAMAHSDPPLPPSVRLSVHPIHLPSIVSQPLALGAEVHPGQDPRAAGLCGEAARGGGGARPAHPSLGLQRAVSLQAGGSYSTALHGLHALAEQLGQATRGPGSDQ